MRPFAATGRFLDRLAGAVGAGIARIHAADRRRVRASGAGPLRSARRAVPQDPNFWARLGITQGLTLDRPFTQHPWVQAVVSSRMRLVAQAPWKIARRAADDSVQDLPAHPLNEVFRRPNRMMTGDMLWGLTQAWLDLLGECVWVLERQNVADAPPRIWPWPGGSIWQPARLGDDKLPATWIRTNADGSRTEIPVAQLVYFRNPNPYDPMRGLPPLVAATETLRADVLADQYQVKLFENGAQPSGFIRYPGPLTDTQADDVLTQFEDRHAGAEKRGRVGILEDGAEWIPTAATNKDMEYLGLREWAKDIVLASFNWPEIALGQFSQETFANAAEAKRSLIEDHLVPMWRSREATLDAQFFRFLEGGTLTGYFDEDRVPAMQVVRESKWDTALKMKAMGVTLEEVNRYLDLGLEPQPAWDVIWRPLNEVPQDTLAEPPAPAPMPAPAPAPPALPLAPEPPMPETLGEPSPERAAALDRLLADEDAKDAARARMADLATTKQSKRQREARRSWRSWNLGVQRPSERPFSRAMIAYHEALWREQMRRFNAAAREAAAMGGRTKVVGVADVNAILFDRPEWDAKLRRLGRPLLENALNLGGAFTENQIGATVFDPAAPEVRALLDQRVKLLSRVNEATEQAVKRELLEGFRLNETVQEIRGRLEGLGNAVSSPARALRIARTESSTMANSVRFQLGEANEDHAVWVSAGDDEVRASHQNAEAQSMRSPVKVGQPFANGLLYPGDPAGPADETVNERCSTMFVPRDEVARDVAANRIRAVLGSRNGHHAKEHAPA